MFWNTFSVWGSVLFGASASVLFSSLRERMKLSDERKEFIRLLKEETKSTTLSEGPIFIPRELTIWPERGSSLVEIILQRNILRGPHYAPLMAQLGKLRAALASYYSYREITATLVSGAISQQDADFQNNLLAMHNVMARQFASVTYEAAMTHNLIHTDYSESYTCWSRLKKFYLENRLHDG